MSMNGRESKTKYGILDDESNYLTLLLFFLISVLSGLITAFSRTPLNASDICIMYVKYLVLLSNMIPVILINLYLFSRFQ